MFSFDLLSGAPKHTNLQVVYVSRVNICNRIVRPKKKYRKTEFFYQGSRILAFFLCMFMYIFLGEIKLSRRFSWHRCVCILRNQKFKVTNHNALYFSTDDILKHFLIFSQKIGFNISCKLETACMKYQFLFSRENIKKLSSSLSSAELAKD